MYLTSLIFAVIFGGILFAYASINQDYPYNYDSRKRKREEITFEPKFLLGSILLAIVWFVISLIVFWGGTPSISFKTGTIYWVLLATLLLSWLGCIMADEWPWDEKPSFRIHTWVLLGYGLIFGGIQIAGSGLFNAHKQQQILNIEVIETSELSDYVAATDVNNMCTVSEKVARRSLMTAMGDFKNTYEIGNLTKQSVTCDFIATLADGRKVHIQYDNHLVYIGLMEHRTFWTWKKLGYSPAYVLADACNEDIYYVITEVNGEPLKLTYTEDAYFGRYLPRYMRNHGYSNVILDDFNIEIDENGRPWAPVTTLENSILLGTRKVTGVALVDIQNGDINWYSPEEAPSFVNMVYPESLVYEYLTWWGDYIYGYFHFSQKTGLVQPCEGMDVIQTQHGCYFYVGIQAQTDNVGTQGYMLIDTRTGEAKYFLRNGISEQEGARVLESNTDLNLEMDSHVLYLTEPIFYNVEGLPTYFATYVSTKDYMVKYYGFCSTTDKNVWGYGTTLEQAKASYMASYYKEAAKSNRLDTSSEMQLVVLEAYVLEKVQEGTAYYLRLEGQAEKVYFVGYSETLPEIRWSAKKVKVSYNPTESNQIALSTYEILER